MPIHAGVLHAQFKICRVLTCRCFRKQLLEGIQDLLKSHLKQLGFSTALPCSGGHLYFLLPLLQNSPLVEYLVQQRSAKIPIYLVEKLPSPGCWKHCSSNSHSFSQCSACTHRHHGTKEYQTPCAATPSSLGINSCVQNRPFVTSGVLFCIDPYRLFT